MQRDNGGSHGTLESLAGNTDSDAGTSAMKSCNSHWLWHRSNKDYVGLTVMDADSKKALARVSFQRKIPANSSTGRRSMTRLPSEDLMLLKELTNPVVQGGYKLRIRYAVAEAEENTSRFFCLQQFERILGFTCPWERPEVHFVLCTLAELLKPTSCRPESRVLSTILNPMDTLAPLGCRAA